MTRTLQSGLQKRGPMFEGPRANGLLLRGVVMATYLLDDPDHPAVTETGDDGKDPVAVYCDVLTYGNKPGLRCFTIPKALVLQDRGSMHNGRVWKPKAASVDITGGTFDPDTGTFVGNMDGDHVLVGFMDDMLNLPVILGGIPHPSHDINNLDLPKGHRRFLKVADGDPDFFKHHGTFFGVDDNGDWLVDTTMANDGVLAADGSEPAPPTDGKGSQKASLPMDAEHRVEFFDMADPMAPVSKSYMSVKKDTLELSLDDVKVWLQLVMAALELKLDGGATVKTEGKDATAKLTLGDGAKSAMIAEAFQTWWDSTLKPLFDAFDNHVHPTGVGPSGPPAPKVVLPVYLASITSTKLKFPDA